MNNKCICVGIDANSIEEAVAKMNEMVRDKILEQDCLLTDTRPQRKPAYKVYIEGNKTIVEDSEGNRAEAKCDEEDVFDVGVGVGVAVSRLNAKKAYKTEFERILIKTLQSVGVTRLVRTESQGIDVVFGYKNGREVAKQMIPPHSMSFMKKDISYAVWDLI